MDDLNALGQNVPDAFERFVGAPSHRLFAVFGEPVAAAEAIDELRAGGAFPDEDDIWVFFGDEGLRRLDLSGSGHGVHGRVLRFFQQQLSGDVDYLRTLGRALGDGHVVVAVMAGHGEAGHGEAGHGEAGHGEADQVADVLRRHGAYSLARAAHWNLVPIPS